MGTLALEGLAVIDLTMQGLWMSGLRRQGRPLLVGGMSCKIMAIVPMLCRQVGTVENRRRYCGRRGMSD